MYFTPKDIGIFAEFWESVLVGMSTSIDFILAPFWVPLLKIRYLWNLLLIAWTVKFKKICTAMNSSFKGINKWDLHTDFYFIQCPFETLKTCHICIKTSFSFYCFLFFPFMWSDMHKDMTKKIQSLYAAVVPYYCFITFTVVITDVLPRQSHLFVDEIVLS